MRTLQPLFLSSLVFAFLVGSSLAKKDDKEKEEEVGYDGDALVGEEFSFLEFHDAEDEESALAGSPTVAPTPEEIPTMAPTGMQYVAKSRLEEVKLFLGGRFGDATVLEQADTPQGKAAHWMAEDDPAMLPIPESINYADAYRFVQRYSLAVLFFSWSTDESGTSSWNTTTLPFLNGDDECDWNANMESAGGTSIVSGVECNGHGEVSYFVLPLQELKGSIPGEVGLLMALSNLALPYNQLEGPLPPQLQYLTALTSLDLQHNELSGNIPASLEQLTELTALHLAHNQFTGEPPQVANLTQLTFLSLQNNELSGDLAFVSSLSSLQSLNLGGNVFTGTLEALLDLINLQELDLSSNQLEGSVFPQPTANATASPSSYPLEFLRLQDNQFTGSLNLTKFPSLVGLDVSNNQFTGDMSDSLSSLPIASAELQYLSLASNPWKEGPILSSQLPLSLQELDLHDTHRTGVLPSDWPQNLELLKLDDNELEGEIPNSLGEELVQLRYLLLNDNELIGTLPASLIYLQDLQVLRVDGNLIGGTALPICGVQNANPSVFAADCTLIECTCCTHCSEQFEDQLGSQSFLETTSTQGHNTATEAAPPPSEIPRGNTICQSSRNSMPHMAGRWGNGFPMSSHPTALCNGRIYETNGDICAIGRVTFQQLRDYLGGGSLLYTTSSSTVSINGLLISGQGNVGLAGTWRYIYDFVTSYTVNGVTYRDTSSRELVDRTFVASRGTIDGFCLDKGALQQGPQEYQISIHRSPPFELRIDDLRDATIVFISSYVMTAEFHGASVPGMDNEPTNGQGLLDSISDFLSDSEFDNDQEPNDPSFEESILGAFSSIGLIRYFREQGVHRTSSMLNGIYEGDDNWAAIEQIQMDTEWDTFGDMVESGWFDGSGNAPPSLDMIVAVRHITANTSSQGCWKQDTAAISVAGPFRAVNDVEDYAIRLYDGIRQYGGSITLHFGKRIPRDRSIVRAALQKYASCGVSLNINVPSNECYHPFCERTERYTRFEWPEAYYDV